jgi:hypothetical protein
LGVIIHVPYILVGIIIYVPYILVGVIIHVPYILVGVIIHVPYILVGNIIHAPYILVGVIIHVTDTKNQGKKGFHSSLAWIIPPPPFSGKNYSQDKILCIILSQILYFSKWLF